MTAELRNSRKEAAWGSPEEECCGDHSGSKSWRCREQCQVWCWRRCEWTPSPQCSWGLHPQLAVQNLLPMPWSWIALHQTAGSVPLAQSLHSSAHHLCTCMQEGQLEKKLIGGSIYLWHDEERESQIRLWTRRFWASKALGYKLFRSNSIFSLTCCDHSYTQCCCDHSSLMESHWHRVLFLQGQSLSIGELQVWWKYAINHARNSGNTCSLENKDTDVPARWVTIDPQLSLQLVSQYLTNRAVRWPWVQLIEKT